MSNVVPLPEHGYWTFERDGELYDGEFTDSQSAYNAAEAVFIDECADGDDYKQDQECDIHLVRMMFDHANGGDAVEKERVPAVLEYEYYHGDFAEHNTWY